jgi:4-hydroxy-tetrahydrodipicolinate synthase
LGEVASVQWQLLGRLLGNHVAQLGAFRIKQRRSAGDGHLCITTATQLRTLLKTAKEVAGDGAEFLCGVGAPDTVGSIMFARIAQDADVKGLLLPMPYFFPYQQGDLAQFSRSVAAATSLPVLIYNLPQFTSGLQKETVHTLITEVPNIIGIKDSGGSLEILGHLSEQGVDACRIVGDDSVLSAALRARVCDGVISGVACAVPELTLALYNRGEQDGSVEFAQATQALDELIAQLSGFPTPWGLKWIAQARGILQATFPLPNSPERVAQGRQFERWFQHGSATGLSSFEGWKIFNQPWQCAVREPALLD